MRRGPSRCLTTFWDACKKVDNQTIVEFSAKSRAEKLGCCREHECDVSGLSISGRDLLVDLVLYRINIAEEL